MKGVHWLTWLIIGIAVIVAAYVAVEILLWGLVATYIDVFLTFYALLLGGA